MFKDQFKNFFYDITITTPDGKRSATLTYNLLRLCNGLEIIEAIASEEGAGASSATITFVEADLLPDDEHKAPLATTAGHGYITNRTGSLIDLRFDSEKGFTYVSPEELQSGITTASRTKSNKSEPVIFLFAANNRVKITWGNLNPKKSRSRTFRIGAINYGSSSSGGQLKLQCYDLSVDMQRLSLSEGKVFVKDPSQAGYQFANPETLKQVMFRLAKTFNARLFFDNEEVINYPVGTDKYILDRTETGADTLPPEQWSPITLIRNTDIHSQIRELAQNYNSTYEVLEDDFTGYPIIKFTSLAQRFPKSVRTLTYRATDGIILDFALNTIDGMAGKETAASAISEDGVATVDTVDVRVADGIRQNTFVPIPYDYDQNAKQYLNRELVSNSVTTPNTDKDVVETVAGNNTLKSSFMGFIQLRTVGDPDFKPDLMNIQGVGVRASTTYRIFQVTHSLSSAGYVCSMQGKTQTVNEAGVSNQEQLAQNEEHSLAQLTDGRQ